MYKIFLERSSQIKLNYYYTSYGKMVYISFSFYSQKQVINSSTSLGMRVVGITLQEKDRDINKDIHTDI
jgi:hypothetical protein